MAATRNNSDASQRRYVRLLLVLKVRNGVGWRGIASACAFLAVTFSAIAQFREIPPAPYSPDAARRKIRTLIANVDPGNPEPAVKALSGMVVWYRDLIDEEFIAAWKGDARANLVPLMKPLADARVATAIVDFSWRAQRQATFTPAYAPMLGDLMERYPASAGPFLSDLTRAAASGGQMPDLTPAEAGAVSRILLDMPDTGTWKQTALRILPYYRTVAQSLLLEDLRADDPDKRQRAEFWLADLHWNEPSAGAGRQLITRTMPSPSAPQARSETPDQRPHIVDEPARGRSANSPSDPGFAAPYRTPYIGPRSGTLKCSGGAVPPNAEFVFPGLPAGHLQVELDAKIWAARLAPDGSTQDLILRNHSASPQKGCTVRWSLIP